jgi:predicted transcriptional regulator
MQVTPPQERKRRKSAVDQFLDAFAEIEAALKKRLGHPADSPAKVSQMIGVYRERNPCWADSCDQLLWFAEIRNLLAHKRNSESGFPVKIAPALAENLARLKTELLSPEPVSKCFRKEVISFSPADTLADVVSAAYRLEFSQFPVLRDGRFAGLITENEITRWLGHRAGSGKANIDLQAVVVSAVLREKESDRKKRPTFQFAAINEPVTEVMSRFLLHPALEVVLLTQSGSGSTPIEGIVTQWDAARFPGSARS